MTTQLDITKSFEPEATAWVNWEEGEFEVQLKYLSLGAAEKLIKDCQVVQFDSRSHQRTEKIDDEKFKKKIADLVIDWRGLTAKKAKKFINLKTDTPDDGEFPCSPSSKLFVISEFPGFPSFILDSAKMLHQIKEEGQEKLEKN